MLDPVQVVVPVPIPVLVLVQVQFQVQILVQFLGLVLVQGTGRFLVRDLVLAVGGLDIWYRSSSWSGSWFFILGGI